MSKKRIFSVDDEAGFLRITTLLLSDYECCGVSNPLKALETARQFKPDMAFLDVVMPELDGGDIAARMKQDPVLKDVPIVFLTAALKKGDPVPWNGEKFLVKPASKSEIVECIEECLGP